MERAVTWQQMTYNTMTFLLLSIIYLRWSVESHEKDNATLSYHDTQGSKCSPFSINWGLRVRARHSTEAVCGAHWVEVAGVKPPISTPRTRGPPVPHSHPGPCAPDAPGGLHPVSNSNKLSSDRHKHDKKITQNTVWLWVEEEKWGKKGKRAEWQVLSVLFSEGSLLLRF